MIEPRNISSMSALEIYHLILLHDAAQRSSIIVGDEYTAELDFFNADLAYELAAVNMREVLRLRALLVAGEENYTPNGLYFISSSKIERKS